MARVVRRFRWPGSTSGNLPGFDQPGLVLLIDPDDAAEDPGLSGRAVTVVPPAGEPFEVVVTASAMLDCLGLLFAMAPTGLIPADSEIRWDT